MKITNKNKLMLTMLIASLLVLSLSGTGNAQTTPGQDDNNLGSSPVTMGSIVPVETYTGQISWSIDGVGFFPGITGTVQVEKPAGATVRAAFMGVATTGFTDYALAAGDVQIDGDDFVWSIQTPSSIFSWNYWGEVTSLVKTKIDSAAAGTIDFTITETEDNTHDIDGEILVVIFDDPNQMTTNTIVLLFGAQDINGDTFNIGLAEPLDLSVTTQLDMSLGISYSYQYDGEQQYSIVTVNSERLSTSAGGEDDGDSTNGALITVGGLGDSNSNPADPFATPTNPRSDDELYTLMPYVSNGDDKITVFTENPSNDDNIFFAGLFLNGAIAVVGEGIVLAPADATNPVGTEHTVTATLQDAAGAPIVDKEVTFTVIAGPNTATTGQATTDADGKASFTYSSMIVGTDTIQASFMNSQEQLVVSNEVTKTWTMEQVIPEVPFGTVVGLSSMIIALSLYFVVPKIRGKKTIL
jgi:hypothetical protein